MGNYVSEYLSSSDTKMSGETKEEQAKKQVMGKDYYYAHNRSWDDQGAIVRDGPGVVTGGAPRKLCPETGEPLDAPAGGYPQGTTRSESPEKPELVGAAPPKAIKKFSWSDEGMKVSIMFEMDNAVDIDQGSVEISGDDVTYTMKFSCVKAKPHIFQVKNLYKQIDFEKCKWKVSSSTKSRMKITLVKEKDIRWHNLTQQ